MVVMLIQYCFLTGAGDLVSLAEELGGKLSEEAFSIFLSAIGIQVKK